MSLLFRVMQSLLEPMSRGEYMNPTTRKLILTVVVLLCACGSISFMRTTYNNYTEFLRAVQGMEEELINLEIEGNTVFLTFQFKNESSWELYLINVQFNLYANREYVGNFDMRKRILLQPGETDVVVTAELHPRYVEELTGDEDITLQSFVQAVGIQWFIYGGAVIELPFEKEVRKVSIEEQWVSA